MEQELGGATQDEVSVREIIEALWAGKKAIGLVAAVCLSAATMYAFLAPEIFRAQAVVQLREAEQSRGALGSLIGRLGGFADLAGISLGGASDRGVALATLKSRVVIEGFIRDEKLLPKLYSSKWDTELARWKEDDPEDIPTVWKAYEKFTEDILVITEDRSTGLVTVAIEWQNAADAKLWVTQLISRANSHLREEAIQEGERNLTYLQRELRSVGQIEVQQGAYALVEAELKKLMLAKGGGEFAFKTVDPAVTPEERERPKRLLLVVLGALFGVVLGSIWTLAQRAWQAA